MRFDVFISYSHRDDEPVLAERSGWVSDLHRALEIRLGQVLGREPQIWRDPRLTGFEPFPEKLEERLCETRALLCVLSPSYLNSDWCRREREWFLDAVAKNHDAAASHRIFKVIKTPLPEAQRDEEPEELAPLLGYPFFVDSPTGGAPEELQQAFGAEVDFEYWKRVNKLAYELRTVLDELGPPADAERSNEEPSDAPIVYLSPATADVRQAHDGLRSELSRRGVRVLPDRELPARGAPLRAQLAELIETAELAVHLIGGQRAFVPEGEDLSLTEIEIELGAAAKQQIVWMPRDLEASSRHQASLIDDLRRARHLPERAQLIEGSPELLKGLVIDTLTRQDAAAVPDRVNGGPTANVYLICDESDLDAVEPARQALFDRDCEVTLPVFEGDEAQIRLDHRETLATCDAVLLFWGHAEELWLRRKLRELLKIRGYGRTRPMSATAVLLSTPQTTAKERFRLADGLLLRSAEGDELERFVDIVTSHERSQAR